MQSHGSLDNYIEMHRKRHGLSQEEFALLVDIEQRGTISQFETGLRHPNLPTLIAMEIVFGVPVQDIFRGVGERVKAGVERRAKGLLESIGDQPSPEMIAKYELLARLVHLNDSYVLPVWQDE